MQCFCRGCVACAYHPDKGCSVSFPVVQAQPGCATPTSDLASGKPTVPERFYFDLVSTQLWLCMAPKKRSSTGSVKTAFVDIKDVRPGQTVSVKGKVLSKSGTMTLGDVLWDYGVFRKQGWHSFQSLALQLLFLLCAQPHVCMLFSSPVSSLNEGPPNLELCGHGSMCRTARRGICFDSKLLVIKPDRSSH